MAQVSKQVIALGNRIVGSVSVDSGAIRGEGGPMRPQLVVPLTVELGQQPVESSLAMLAVSADLSTDQSVSAQTSIAQSVSQSLLGGLPARSLPSGACDHTTQLRFFLTPDEVENIERRRHAQSADGVQLYLTTQPVVAAVKHHNSVTPNQPTEQTPWKLQYGLFSEVMPFWDAKVSPLLIQIEQSVWVRDVLPGLGHGGHRLVELAFPPPLPTHDNAPAQFDRAKRALDERRYDECIDACRGLLGMWEKQYGATTQEHVAAKVAAARGWTQDDVRTQLLDALWQKLGDVARAAHHPESDDAAHTFTYQDARLVLLLTSAASEYVQLPRQ